MVENKVTERLLGLLSLLGPLLSYAVMEGGILGNIDRLFSSNIGIFRWLAHQHLLCCLKT